MIKFVKKSEKIGLPPGTPLFVGEVQPDIFRVSVIDYDEANLLEMEEVTLEECVSYKESKRVTWINVCGVGRVKEIESLCKSYGIHPLVIEDIVDTEHRPKIDYYDDYIYIVMKVLTYDDEKESINIEQISIVLGKNFVLTFQENASNIFSPIQKRIATKKGQIRKMEEDYLTYALMDAIVDHYFEIAEKFSEQIEEIEESLLFNPNNTLLQDIFFLKREIIFFRKTIWPLREVVSRLKNDPSTLVKKTTRFYLRDLYDHIVHVMDTIETLRDMNNGMLEIYHSSLSNRMNEIMKFLTVMGSIFIPLTFIVGVYGMNFEFMPELKWKWGYFAAWGLMVSVGSGLLLYFKKKNWI